MEDLQKVIQNQIPAQGRNLSPGYFCHLVERYLPGHTNVIGTLPRIPYPDMYPSMKCSVTSLHGHLFANTVSKAIAGLLRLRHRHAHSLSHLQVLTPTLVHSVRLFTCSVAFPNLITIKISSLSIYKLEFLVLVSYSTEALISVLNIHMIYP